MTLSQSRMPARSVGAGRNPSWEESPNAPGVLCTLQQPEQRDSENATAPIRFESVVEVPELSARGDDPGSGQAGGRERGGAGSAVVEATATRGNRDGYDEIDRRLLDTFPASDAVARY